MKHMNWALAYIEEHLAEEIDFSQVAQIALCSEYHFRRMFSSLAGLSLSEYVRRRRLTMAAIDLVNNGEKVIDVALKYGYSSPDAFTRAFCSWHGVNPSEAKKDSHQLKFYSRLTFQLTIQGANEMNYRIVEKEPFFIVGLYKRVPLVYHGVNPEIVAMSALLTPDLITQLKGLSNIEPRGIISASTNFSEGRAEGSELDHYIGVATTAMVPDDLACLTVPAMSWAVFEAVGPFPETLQNVWQRIYTEWFPTVGYEQVAGPEILWNESQDISLPNYRSEIWIPVRGGGREGDW
ncbi:MAG TPA: AraC family transcriptional regulator [Anaerolineae bacterium]|nr:AraC family transcriptional regulator [Anaerolineae bacterium]